MYIETGKRNALDVVVVVVVGGGGGGVAVVAVVVVVVVVVIVQTFLEACPDLPQRKNP